MEHDEANDVECVASDGQGAQNLEIEQGDLPTIIIGDPKKDVEVGNPAETQKDGEDADDEDDENEDDDSSEDRSVVSHRCGCGKLVILEKSTAKVYPGEEIGTSEAAIFYGAR